MLWPRDSSLDTGAVCKVCVEVAVPVGAQSRLSWHHDWSNKAISHVREVFEINITIITVIEAALATRTVQVSEGEYRACPARAGQKAETTADPPSSATRLKSK
ncbi:MAG: hypothetical protein DHS20C16_22100 [Phycisphaerae bacterium]|nr:MAG: hypothetical protein DHS20C16_22100 [Phycisphaerae bacterium]